MNEKRINLTLNINDIRENYLLFRKITKQGDLCIPVVKTNGYGFDQIDVVSNLLEIQKDYFVYSIEEASELRRVFGNKIRNIYCITGPMNESHAEVFFNYDIIPVLNSKEQLETWYNTAKNKGKKLKFLAQVNLGLNRSGFNQDEIQWLKKYIDENSKYIELSMIIGHLACQYEINSEKGQKYTTKEIKIFENATKYFPNIKKSLLASFGVLNIPDAMFDSTRIGTFLYTGQPGEKQDLHNNKFVFKTAVNITAPVFLGEHEDEIYINLGIKHGQSSCYGDNGYVYIEGKKIYAKKVERERTIFKVENNREYEGKTALVIGYLNNDYIDGYTFSCDMSGSVPEEILFRMIFGANLYPADYDQEIIGGHKFKNAVRDFSLGIEPRNTATYNTDGTIKKLTSTITEIRTIFEDGAVGYDSTESVNKGDVVATFPMGYADGLNRKFRLLGFTIFVQTQDNEIIECPFCGSVPMDQMCFKIDKKYKDKIKVGDRVLIIDKDNNIITDRFLKKINLTEEELFYLVRGSYRVKKLN